MHPSVPFVFSQETFTTDDVVPSESSFMTCAEIYDQDEPEFHKPKKPVIKIPKRLKAKVRRHLGDVAPVTATPATSKRCCSHSRSRTRIGRILQELRLMTICQKLLK